MPIKISRGNISVWMPASLRTAKNPPASAAPPSGILANTHPNPIGTSRTGSTFLAIPNHMRTPPITNIATACQVKLRKPRNSPVAMSIVYPFFSCFSLGLNSLLRRIMTKSKIPRTAKMIAIPNRTIHKALSILLLFCLAGLL